MGTQPDSPAPKVSAWAPMAITAFRVLWFAQLGSNIGTWMQTVGAQWFLVEAAAGPTVIALVQTASLAPAVLFSLPAGVLADSLDRRRLLIVGSAVSALIAGVLTVIAALHHLTPWTILGFTFLLGITSTLTSPAWQAIQPELVPRSMIGASSALGGVTVNGVFSHYLENRLPFGGVNGSGMGSYHGYFGFKAFSHERAIYLHQ